jgi:zinc transporter 2
MFVVLHPGTCGGSTSHGHSHGSNHGHSHDTNENLSKEDISDQLLPSKNINVKAAMVHVIGDFVQSIGVLIAAILIKVNVC